MFSNMRRKVGAAFYFQKICKLCTCAKFTLCCIDRRFVSNINAMNSVLVTVSKKSPRRSYIYIEY